MPANRWSVLIRTSDAKSAPKSREKRLDLDVTVKARMTALTPSEVVLQDQTYLLDSLEGGMVTEGGDIHRRVYAYTYTCMKNDTGFSLHRVPM